MLPCFIDHMYYFEGKDYSKDPSTDDQKSFDRLLEEQLEKFQKAVGEGRALRHKAKVRRWFIWKVFALISRRWLFF